MKKVILLIALFLVTLSGCSATNTTNTTSASASASVSEGKFNWIIVQYSANGDPVYAWVVKNSDDKILHYYASAYSSFSTAQFRWTSPEGHWVFSFTNHTTVRVKDDKFEEAAKLVGVEYEKITNGRYTP